MRDDTESNHCDSASARAKHKQPNPMRMVRKQANKAAWAMARMQADARMNIEQIEEQIAKQAAEEAHSALELMEGRRSEASYNDLSLSAFRLVTTSRLIREKPTIIPGRVGLTDDQKKAELLELLLTEAKTQAIDVETDV